MRCLWGKVSFLLLISNISSSVVYRAGETSQRNSLRERADGSRRVEVSDEQNHDGTDERWDEETLYDGGSNWGGDGASIAETLNEVPGYETQQVAITSTRPTDDRISTIWDPLDRREVYVYLGKDTSRSIRAAWRGGLGIDLVNIRYSIAGESRAEAQRSLDMLTQRNPGRGIIASMISSSFTTSGLAQSNKHLLLIKTAANLARAKHGNVVVRWFGSGNGKTVHPDSFLINKRHLDGRKIKRRSSEMETLVKPVLLKSSDQAHPAQRATLIDIPTSAIVHKRTASNTIIQELDIPVNSSPQPSGLSSISAASQFDVILAAYQSVQANISNTIFPILTNMTSKTNSSLIFQAARSIWVDLVAPNQVAVGPFLYGLNCLDDLADYQAKELNLTVSDPRFQPFLAVSAILLEIYEDAWNRSYTAVNQSGLLNELYTLGSKLLVNSNSSFAPPTFFQPSNDTYNDSFFTDYNRNKNLDQFLL